MSSFNVLRLFFRPQRDADFEVYRAQIIDGLILLTIGMAAILMAVDWIEGVIYQVWIDVGIIFLVSTLYFLIRRGNRQVVFPIYINLIAFLIMISSYLAFETGRFTETENWLYPLLPISVFLLDGRRMFVQSILIFLYMVAIKFTKYSMLPNAEEFFMMTIVNIVLFMLSLFVLIYSYKRIVQYSLEKASESARLKHQLFSIVTHDVRNPINALKGLVQIKEDNLDPETTKKFLNMIGNRLEDVSQSMDDLLIWAKDQMENFKASPEQVDLNSAVSDVAKTYDLEADLKGIKIDCFTSEDAVGVIDKGHLNVALRNCLHNAIKFSSKDSAIQLRTFRQNGHAGISIIDQGKGIDPHTKEQIIRNQIPSSSLGTSGEKGSGLGLGLSIGLLKRNGCSLRLEDNPEGGTEVRILVPRA